MSAATCIACGLGFTEGPLWTGDSRLLVASVSRACIYEVDLTGGPPRLLAEAGGTPTGLAEDPEGRIWIAQGGREGRSQSARRPAPSIQCLDLGEVRDVAGGFFGPNDCAVGPDGRLWFTDPRGPALEGDPLPGRVCALDRANGSVATVCDGILYPNGLAFSPLEAALYVAETFTGRILRLALDRPGAEPEVFATLSAGRPDGLAFDSEGRLHAAAYGAPHVEVFDRHGRGAELLPLGDDVTPTNLCFGGDDLRTLFVTVPKGGRVLALERSVAGLSLTQLRPAERFDGLVDLP